MSLSHETSRNPSQASSGGSYVVTTGLFAVGGIQTLLGLYQMMKG